MSELRSLPTAADLEFRLRGMHRRRRRALIHQVVTVACWAVGLIMMATFIVALAISAVAK